MSEQKNGREDWGWTARLVVSAVALALLVIFVAENFVLVEVRIFLVRVETRLAWALLLSAFLGFIFGLVLPRLRR